MKNKPSIRIIIKRFFSLLVDIFVLFFCFVGAVYITIFLPIQTNSKILMIIPHPIGIMLFLFGVIYLTGICNRYPLVNKIFHLSEIDEYFVYNMKEKEKKKTVAEKKKEERTGAIISAIITNTALIGITTVAIVFKYFAAAILFGLITIAWIYISIVNIINKKK